MKVGNLKDGPFQIVTHTATGEVFTQYHALTQASGARDLSVMVEQLEPGHRSSSAHWHSHIDEAYVILSGAPLLESAGQTQRLQSGDYVIFPAGQPRPHLLRNDTTEPVEFLKLSSVSADDRISYQCEPAASD